MRVGFHHLQPSFLSGSGWEEQEVVQGSVQRQTGRRPRWVRGLERKMAHKAGRRAEAHGERAFPTSLMSAFLRISGGNHEEGDEGAPW